MYEVIAMKHDFTIFRYSTLLALTRAGYTTFAELEKLSNAEIANIRGLGKRGYDEILEKLGRQSGSR
jgi:DNA-directed RNA polymerase alpha subunit